MVLFLQKASRLKHAPTKNHYFVNPVLSIVIGIIIDNLAPMRANDEN